MFPTRHAGLLVLSSLILIGSINGSIFAEIPDDSSQFHLFLLAGQSNMAGRGTVEEDDRAPHPRLLMLDKTGQWVPAVDPLHFDKPKVIGVGLGKTFGIDYAQANPRITVGLIPCAVGGSPISSWKPGGYHPQTKSHPYDDAIARTKLAMKSGVLKGILWHQGESDSKPRASEVYEQELHHLIARFRQVFDAPDLPFVAGQMGKFADRPWDEDRRRRPTARPIAFATCHEAQHRIHSDRSWTAIASVARCRIPGRR